MWPWLMIIAGVLLIVGALIARQRMMRDYHEHLAAMEAEERQGDESPRDDEWAEEPAPAGVERRDLAEADEVESRDEVRSPVDDVEAADEVEAADQVDEEEDDEATSPAAEAPAAQAPSRPRITITEPTPGAVPTVIVPAPRTPAPSRSVPSSQPLFADSSPTHQLTEPPTIRVRALDVPLQDWLRYYAEGNAWSGVIQSVSDRITGDRELQPYFGHLDTSSLQRHVMSTVMMLTGEGVTVGAVRQLAGAHLQFVQAGGDPVTEPVWDRLALTFKNALREHGVPESAVNGVDVTAAPLKSVIVARGAR